MEWQPIETAPKDIGILLSDGEMIVGFGRWHNGAWVFWEGDESSIIITDEMFSSDNAAILNEWLSGYGPSYWMPLPPPPQEAAP